VSRASQAACATTRRCGASLTVVDTLAAMGRRDRSEQAGPQPPFDTSADVLTAENAVVTVSATVSFEITDPTAFSNFSQAAELTVITALRNEIGARDLAQTLDSAPELSRALPARCAALLAGHGGITIMSVEVTGIVRSPDQSGPDYAFVRARSFSVVLRGYDRAYVDDLLERGSRALAADDRQACAAIAKELTRPVPVRLRGYDRIQVDSRLRMLSELLSLRLGT
jgi:hypothetical protein